MTRVLVVDDHAVVRRGVLQVLAAELPDLVLEEAGDAAGALALVEAGRADLVVLDLVLPGRGGLSLLGELRRRFPDLPVLVLSAYPEGELAARCLALGAAGYLPKDSAAESLGDAVGRILSGERGLAVAPLPVEGATGRRRDARALSARELQVLRLVATGRTLREVAASLGVTAKTVASYRARLASKLGLQSAVELTRYALSRGLLDPLDQVEQPAAPGSGGRPDR